MTGCCACGSPQCPNCNPNLWTNPQVGKVDLGHQELIRSIIRVTIKNSLTPDEKLHDINLLLRDAGFYL